MRSNSGIANYIMECASYDGSQVLGLYRLSQQFKCICDTLDSFSGLISKQEGYKLQLDIPEGQELFRKYMSMLELLGQVLKPLPQKLAVRTVDRSYRLNFSKAYRFLYAQGNLGYIHEILDSAQEGFPYLWVNGEKYNFSEQVLLRAEQLVECFYRVQQTLRIFYTKVESFVFGLDLNKERALLKQILEEFDVCWTRFERGYIEELMVIEQLARSPMENAIAAEAQLNEFEESERLRGKIFISGERYTELRANLCSIIAHLNSVANYQGKGRDDLGLEVLLQAEDILHKVSMKESKAVRLLAHRIRECFLELRRVIRSFAENPQLIDPQLRNNTELVEQLLHYQRYWQQGKRYFLEQRKRQQLLQCSELIEATEQKYPNFHELLECNDPELFVVIPCLVILKSLEFEDCGLVSEFLADLEVPGSRHHQQYCGLKTSYQQLKDQHQGRGYFYYNCVEAALIDKQSCTDSTIKQIVGLVRNLAIDLERTNPIEWNNLLNALLPQDGQSC